MEAEWNEAAGPVRVEEGKASGSVSILPALPATQHWARHDRVWGE